MCSAVENIFCSMYITESNMDIFNDSQTALWCIGVEYSQAPGVQSLGLAQRRQHSHANSRHQHHVAICTQLSLAIYIAKQSSKMTSLNQVQSSATSTQSDNRPRSTKLLPDIHLLCMQDEAAEAFESAVTSHFPDLNQQTNITIHDCSLKYLDQSLRFDAVVSPANSYGRLDGAFDDALARAYGPPGDYDWITRKAQGVLYEQWRGYAPPGTCTVVRLDHKTFGDAPTINPWSTEYLLLCPTMHIPCSVTWDREIVYECIWSLLCAVDGHNRKLRTAGSSTTKAEKPITSILMTPLATGVGRVSNQRWAEQLVIALKHWTEAVEKPEVWSRMTWEAALTRHGELTATYSEEGQRF